MFWAFLFFIDFRIGMDDVYIDVLPDFVGWALIASALTWILGLAPEIRGIRALANWLVLLSIFDLVEIRLLLGWSGNITLWVALTFVVTIATTILDLIVIWRLCEVIMEMASAVGNGVMRDRAGFRRKLYVGSGIAVTLLVTITFAVPQFALVALGVGLPLAIVVFCLMMGLMKATENMCRGLRV